MTKKKSDCKSCDDLTARLDRLEKRLEAQEDATAHWHKRWGIVSNELKVANGRISVLEAENTKLKKTIVKKDARISNLEKMLFSPTSEVSKTNLEPEEIWEAAPPKKRRGKQPGSQGHGRKIRCNLPVEEQAHDVPETDKCCKRCGCSRERLPFTEDSEEIHYSYKLVRIKHKRLKYKRTCKCTNEPAIITAPTPDKLIPKGLFSTEFWAHVLLEKFLLQRPISRICLSLELNGLSVSDGTLCSGLKQLTKLFAPIYNAIRTRTKSATHWQMDETHWQVFTDLMGKDNHKWWLWVTETSDASLFVLDPSRSSSVPLRVLSDVTAGVLTCDRYSAYKPLVEQGVLLSYCWAHVRRDFINLGDGYPKHKRFAEGWIKDIDKLFFLNKQRQPDSLVDLEIRGLCERMERKARRLLRKKNTSDESKPVLSSLIKHWAGLTLFLEHPSIPLDNNASERALRNPVVGRKNYYGSRAIWSGWLSSMLFSIFATVRKNNQDPQQYLIRYLRACAQNKGSPPTDISEFLPWLNQQATPRLPLARVD